MRVVSRKSLSAAVTRNIIPAPASSKVLAEQTKSDTVHEQLLRLKQELGAEWPLNIRIEPVVTKAELKHVDAAVRKDLKAMLKER
jgi:hypothetical protein